MGLETGKHRGQRTVQGDVGIEKECAFAGRAAQREDFELQRMLP
jgi:hypothetical protein